MGIYSLLLFMLIGHVLMVTTIEQSLNSGKQNNCLQPYKVYIAYCSNARYKSCYIMFFYTDDQIIMRLDHLESENKEQKHRIEFLELKVEDYHNGMKQMEEKLKYYVGELENKNCCNTHVEGGSIQTSASPKNTNIQHNADNQHLQKGNKRPARLLPAYIFK